MKTAYEYVFGKDDWRTIWTKTAKWQVPIMVPDYNNFSRNDGMGLKSEMTTEKCRYEILYSKSRNEYKLRLGGYNPKDHPAYQIAVQKLNTLINAQTTI